MSDSIKLLRGIVHEKSDVKALRYIRLYNGRAQASDGAVTLDVPFDADGLDVTVPGEKFLTAMTREGSPTLKMMRSGRLQVKNGALKLSLVLLDNKLFPLLSPDGEKFTNCDKLYGAFQMVKPFTGGERVWLNGVHMRDDYLYATNGFSMIRVRTDAGVTIGNTIPIAAITKIVAIKEPVTALRAGEYAVTFKLGDDIWLRTQLITEQAPNMERLISDTDIPIPDGLGEALEQITPYLAGKYPVVRIDDHGVHEGTIDGSGTDAVVEGSFSDSESRFRVDLLSPVLALATHLDLRPYPAACPWNNGDDVCGAIMGVAAT